MLLRKTFNILLFSVFLLSFAGRSAAQKTLLYDTDLRQYREGLDLVDKEKYSAAQQKFSHVIALVNDPNNEVQINSEYYKALCALRLYNKDADYQMSQFIDNYPESPWVRVAYFQLGEYHYSRKKYWLAPVIVIMVLFGGLIVLTQGSAVAPFIYTIF